MYIDDGKIRAGTPLARLEEEIAGKTLAAVSVLAGDLDDVCNTLPGDKLAASLKELVAGPIGEGNVTARVKVKVDEIRQLIAACKKAAAKAA